MIIGRTAKTMSISGAMPMHETTSEEVTAGAFDALLKQGMNSESELLPQDYGDNSSNPLQNVNNQDVYKKEVSSNPYQDTGTQSKETIKGQDNEITSETGEVSTEPTEISEEVKEVMSEVDVATGKIKDVILEELGISEEELMACLEAMGLNMADLLNVSNLKNVVMQLTGSSDVGALLLNENFQAIFSEATNITKDLLTQLGMTMEELTATIEQAMQSTNPEESMNPLLNESAKTVNESFQSPRAVAEEVESDANQKGNKTIQVNTQDKEGYVTVHKSETVATGDNSNSQGMAHDPSGESMTKGNQQQQQQQLTPGMQTIETVQTTTAADGSQVTQVVRSYIDTQDVMRQVTQFAKVHVTPSMSSMEMQLNPANLGKIYLQISSKAGVITASIAAQNEAVKEVMEGQMTLLKESLNTQGLKVEAVEVTVATHEFERNLMGNQQNQTEDQPSREQRASGRRDLNLNSLEEIEDSLTEDELLATQIMRDSGNRMILNA